jgi:hypothetical protein
MRDDSPGARRPADRVAAAVCAGLPIDWKLVALTSYLLAFYYVFYFSFISL